MYYDNNNNYAYYKIPSFTPTVSDTTSRDTENFSAIHIHCIRLLLAQCTLNMHIVYKTFEDEQADTGADCNRGIIQYKMLQSGDLHQLCKT